MFALTAKHVLEEKFTKPPHVFEDVLLVRNQQKISLDLLKCLKEIDLCVFEVVGSDIEATEWLTFDFEFRGELNGEINVHGVNVSADARQLARMLAPP